MNETKVGVWMIKNELFGRRTGDPGERQVGT
jgi:hypothetical protein